ncbi:hypothetical protein BDQ17DRAFT_1352402 [Cyathus striatus]|nr:hypothetical protein BDQ17DRAFT_1352402 [Cyathus striatus]
MSKDLVAADHDPQLPWSRSQLHTLSTSRLPPSDPRNPHSAPPADAARLPDRAQLPTRSSTVPDADRTLSPNPPPAHSRSDDLNHSSLSASPPTFLSSSPHPNNIFLPSSSPSNSHPDSFSSRPSSPPLASKLGLPSSSSSAAHSDASTKRNSVLSVSSSHSSSSTQSAQPRPPPTATSSVSTSTSTTLVSATCSACGKPMQGPFVRALGTVFHLNCFKCMDCGDVVASKFFPIEGTDGKQQPLCERDYFRRLNLICAKCGMALRGSYITACNKKYHVEHFTCSLCPTLFGPQDSYYEHDGDVFCHFHYSTRFATKCAGCGSAILKQFVEINRNMRDECWHPECYMINKFWNVKVVSRRPTSAASTEGENQDPAYVEEEQRETPASLKDKQTRMEQQVYRIWTVLSAFEESSAACISDMLRQVSNGQYLDAIRMAEKFILHVEVLFGTIDDLEFHFSRLNMKGMSHVREARMLCRKTVELFTLLSHTQETGARRMGMTQELLALVTGLAHYLKILIRIALTGALKLERDQSVRDAMSSFLDKLHLLAVQGGNPTARRMIKGSNGESIAPNPNNNYGTQGVTYGFRSLSPENAGESPFRDGGKLSSSNPPSDLCVKCNQTVEEDCVRLGTYQRWHSHCVQCAKCGKVAAAHIPVKEQPAKSSDEKEGKEVQQPPKLSTARRPPANVNFFVFDPESIKETNSFGEVPTIILCTDHAHPGCRGGFQPVQRLEQYAFLLNVALRRLYLLLKKQGVVPLSPVASLHGDSQSSSDLYRGSGDMMKMKSVHLDRKLSATAHLPKRSTIVESPAGRSVHPSEVLHPQRQQEISTPQPHQSHMTSAQSQQGQQVHVHTHHHHHHQGQTVQPGQNSFQPSPPSQHARPNLSKLPTGFDSSNQNLRPSIGRNNTEVRIVDDSAPNSPAKENESPIPGAEQRFTLSDIPHMMAAAKAHEEQSSLPRDNSTPYIAELSALELAIVRHAAVLLLSRSPLKDQFDLDEILEMVETKKSGFWNKLFKGDKKNVKKKGVFGVPLELLVEREGADSLLGTTAATMRIPSFIDDVISAMKTMDMSVEGIFRKNGNIRRLKDLTDAIDRDPSSVDLTQDNPVQLAALLKKFLRDLPDPLMTFKLHRLFIAAQNLSPDEDRKRYLHLLSLIMPKSHRDTMEVLFVFLKWVASFAHMDAETGSKMDLGNLATVICPSILYARGRDAMRDDTFGALRVVTSLLENQDEFFTVPAELLPILHDQDYFTGSLDLPSKEFLKKCDSYMRSKGGLNGRPHPGSPFIGLNNGNAARYPPLNSPITERPPLGTLLSSDRIRVPPAQMHDGYLPAPSGSPSIPQGMVQTMQRGQPPEDWLNQPLPRPTNPGTGQSSRPSSYAGQPRPSGDQAPYGPGMNGYPSAVGQRT